MRKEIVIGVASSILLRFPKFVARFICHRQRSRTSHLSTSPYTYIKIQVLRLGFFGGDSWVRTSDLMHVKHAL